MLDRDASAVVERLRRLRHDLRTPVNQIIGYSELLREVAADTGNTDMDGDLGRINDAARLLLNHIEHCMTDMLGSPPGATDRSQDIPPPVAPQAVSEAIVPRGPPAAAAVLVVDDNALNRDMLARRLSRSGYRVSTAEDGYLALEMIAAGEFDAIVLDVMMPGISGFEVLRALRREHDVTRLPVIMATARNDSSDIVEALELGANDYVTKPIDFPVVLARLETHLELRRINEQARDLAAELERGKQFIRSVFGRYHSDAVVDSLLDRPQGLQLGGSSRDVTVLMSDLRGFSSMSERLSPEDVVRVLNLYLGHMTDIIQSYGGTIDEFIGDAILVVFGAPTAMPAHAECAVACALGMQLAMADVNRESRALGLPEIEMGIGVNTGTVVVGNIGSEKRSKYGVVGRNVNLAARIESYTVGGQVLVSEQTVHQITIPVRDNGSARVSPKGCNDALTLVSVCGIGGRHNLELPLEALDMDYLAEPVAVHLAVLDGVHVPRLEQAARLMGLSDREAELAVQDADFPLLSSVAFEIDPPGPKGRVFGKISRVDLAAGRVVLRFPSAPGPVGAAFADWRRAVRPAD